MAITSSNSSPFPAALSMGPKKVQILSYSALSGATSGTITADQLKRVEHILLGGRLRHSAAPTFADNIATLAFTVPAETAASVVVDGITYTAVANLGQDGNSITIELVDGTGDTPAVTKGTETVAVVGNAITVHIDPTAVIGSAQTDVRVAVNASAAAAALVAATGTSATVAAVTAATPLAGGVTGGSSGMAICVGV